MKLYTSEHCKMAEKHAIEELGVPSILLMEHAARGVYDEILRVFPRPQKYKFLVLYGSGNNGGDALCLARMLLLKSCKVDLLEVMGEPETLDSKLQKKFLVETIKKNDDGGSSAKVNFLNFSNALAYVDENTIVIDGVFGTGFDSKKSTKINAEVIELFTNLKRAKSIFSIDVPSGLDSDTGEVAKWAICADHTITFIYPKVGLFVAPGSLNSGKVKIKSLFFPKETSFETKYELITPKLIRNFLEILKRKPDSHKGTYGHVAILAPQDGMEGAAAMSALAALRSGAGLTTILALDEPEESLRRRMVNLVPEAIIQSINLNETELITKQFEKFDSLIAGPGFGKENKDKFKKVIEAFKGSIVLDADALNIISEDWDIFNIIKTKPNVILTPHPGEMLRLFPEGNDIQSQRLNVLENFFEKYSPSLPPILLKGYRSMLGVLQNAQNIQESMQDGGSPKYKIFVNPTGGPALSKGGSGDALSGMIAAFYAQGLALWQAGILATFLHGLCADVLVKKRGTEFDILPTDVIDEISEAVKCLIF